MYPPYGFGDQMITGPSRCQTRTGMDPYEMTRCSPLYVHEATGPTWFTRSCSTDRARQPDVALGLVYCRRLVFLISFFTLCQCFSLNERKNPMEMTVPTMSST